jgi:hypothetical protein
MKARKTHDVVATVGKYQSNGEEKKRYLTCGSAFSDDQGRISIKLDAVPVTPEWSGWLSLYPVKDQPKREERPQRQEVKREPMSSPQEQDSDIPF